MSTDAPPSPTTRRRSGGSPSKALLKLGVGFAAAGVVALFGAQAWLESYLKGEPFRRKTEAAIGRALHAQSSVGPLQRQGSALLTESVGLNGQTGAFFKTAHIQDLRAELNLGAIWRRVWKVDTLRFQRLELNLDAPAEAPAEYASATSGSSHWWAALLPLKTEIDSIQTDRASLTRGGAVLRNTRLGAKPLDGGWDVTLEAGELQWPGMPGMDLSQARLVARERACVLRSARLLVKAGGQISLSGNWDAESGAEIHAQVENVDVQPFLPVWWQTRLHGSLQGNLRFAKPAAAKEGEISGDLKLTGAMLEALPLLTQLDTFIGNPRFRQVPLKTASVHFSQTAERTQLRDLDLDAGGVLRITGTVTVKAGALQGSLKLGISPSLVQWLPEIRSKVFAESRDGYLWTPFELSGTTEQPKEDLTARLAALVVETAVDTVRGLPGKIPQALPEAAKGILDAVKSLIPIK